MAIKAITESEKLVIRHAGARLIIAALAILTVGACETAEQHTTQPPVTTTSNIGSAITSTSITTTTTSTSIRTGPAGVPLYEQFESQGADGPKGNKPVNATLAGTNYRNSTGMWVGCVNHLTGTGYHLGGRFRRLEAVAGLLPDTPAGMSVFVAISVEGRLVADFKIRGTETRRLDIDLTGADSLQVRASAVDNFPCTKPEETAAYGALGDAMLTPAGYFENEN